MFLRDHAMMNDQCKIKEKTQIPSSYLLIVCIVNLNEGQCFKFQEWSILIRNLRD